LGSPQFSSFYFLSNWRVFLGGEKRDIYIYIYIYIAVTVRALEFADFTYKNGASYRLGYYNIL
jgi:hypothetical protein